MVVKDIVVCSLTNIIAQILVVKQKVQTVKPVGVCILSYNPGYLVRNAFIING